MDFRDNTMSLLDKISETLEQNHKETSMININKEHNYISFHSKCWSNYQLESLFTYCGLSSNNFVDEWMIEPICAGRFKFTICFKPILIPCKHQLIYREKCGNNVCQICGQMFSKNQ